jgi:hypothetical protein
MPGILNISKWECRAVQAATVQHKRYIRGSRASTLKALEGRSFSDTPLSMTS